MSDGTTSPPPLIGDDAKENRGLVEEDVNLMEFIPQTGLPQELDGMDEGDHQTRIRSPGPYMVRDLDTGENFQVEKLEEKFNLFTLDDVEGNKRPISPLETMYSKEDTVLMAEIMPLDNEITDANETKVEEEIKASGTTKADIAMEEARALSAFLLPSGAPVDSIRITDHAFIRSKQGRLYTVYKIEVKRGKIASDAATALSTPWFVYRRYQQFRALNDDLRPKGYQVPLLPPKKLIGSSCEPDFLQKRREDLSKWLEQLIQQKQSATQDILGNENVRRFLTADADEIPAGLMKEHPDFKRSSVKGDTFRGDSPKTMLKDFQLIKVIGKGSFGKVMLVRKKDTQTLYAMKVLNKANVVKRKQVDHTRTERRVLGRTKHPFIVTLHYAFQDPEKLYFVLDYCAGGELFFHLTRQKKVNGTHGTVLYCTDHPCSGPSAPSGSGVPRS